MSALIAEMVVENQTFLEHLVRCMEDRPDDPLITPWPSRGNVGGSVSFSTVAEWRDFILSLSLRQGIPEIVTAKFERAQKLFFLGWIDGDLIKAGELVAFTALELALTDRYGRKPLAALLADLVERDGLTDDKIPMIQRCGGSVISRLTGEVKPSLAEIRNSLAHGYPLDASPWSGLFELIRDLINYAYRNLVRT